MPDMLGIVVNKLAAMEFVDDEFRNNREGNKEVNLQYFYKRAESSNWEVYVSYNPHNSLLTICYYDIYEKDNSYPVAFVAIKNQNDALIACDLLESKANYLWAKVPADKNKSRGEALGNKLKRMGFESKESVNNISTLKKRYKEYELTVLIESAVSLSTFVFKNHREPDKDYPLLAVRNIHEEPALDVITNYLSNFHKNHR